MPVSGKAPSARRGRRTPVASRGGRLAARMPRKDVETVFARFAAAMPEPKGELHYINPFTLLVAVVLSAQATDAGVNKATPALFQLADTPQKMAALGEARVTELIRTIGLYRTKARNVVALSQEARRRSRRRGAALARGARGRCPGVGRKTANVVLNIAFGEPTMAVDTHIFRVSQPDRHRPGRNPARGRGRARARRPRALQAPRPSLADPSRPLCLQGAQARLSELPDQRPLPLARQDGLTPLRFGASWL